MMNILEATLVTATERSQGRPYEGMTEAKREAAREAREIARIDSLNAKCRWCKKVVDEGQAYCSLYCFVCYDDA